MPQRRSRTNGLGASRGGSGRLTDMLLPNFYLFVSLHNGLGSLHGIRTGRAKRATHATETRDRRHNGRGTRRTERRTKGQDRQQKVNDARNGDTHTQRQSTRRCARGCARLPGSHILPVPGGAGAASSTGLIPVPVLHCVMRTARHSVRPIALHAASCTAKTGKMLRASCA